MLSMVHPSKHVLLLQDGPLDHSECVWIIVLTPTVLILQNNGTDTRYYDTVKTALFLTKSSIIGHPCR